MANKPVSFTYTAVIFTGLAIAVFGAIVAVFGIGGGTAFDGSIFNAKIKTENVGLVLLVVGSALAGYVAVKLPKGVRVFSSEAPTFTERLGTAVARPALLIACLGAIALIVSLVVS